MARSVFRYGLYGFACLCLLFPSLARADEKEVEYLVKATFIYNFIKFVEWPDAKAVSKQSNINICQVGESALSGANSVFKKASTPKLTLSLVRRSAKALSDCHIVFIGQSEESRVQEILSSLAGQPVLVVSDIEGFAKNGGTIGFAMQNNKVKLVVNMKSAAAANMRIDSQLLEIAKVIER